jgi:hypothetical protein
MFGFWPILQIRKTEIFHMGGYMKCLDFGPLSAAEKTAAAIWGGICGCRFLCLFLTYFLAEKKPRDHSHHCHLASDCPAPACVYYDVTNTIYCTQ